MEQNTFIPFATIKASALLNAFQMEKSKHNQLATKRLLLITYEENFSVDFLVFPELAVIKILEEKKKLSRTSQEKTAIAIKLVATLLH